MKKLNKVLKDMGFSKELEKFIMESQAYDTYNDIPDSITIEIEQQNIISSNNIVLNTNNFN